jgi:hypothetical protein
MSADKASNGVSLQSALEHLNDVQAPFNGDDLSMLRELYAKVGQTLVACQTGLYRPGFKAEAPTVDKTLA